MHCAGVYTVLHAAAVPTRAPAAQPPLVPSTASSPALAVESRSAPAVAPEQQLVSSHAQAPTQALAGAFSYSAAPLAAHSMPAPALGPEVAASAQGPVVSSVRHATSRAFAAHAVAPAPVPSPSHETVPAVTAPAAEPPIAADLSPAAVPVFSQALAPSPVAAAKPGGCARCGLHGSDALPSARIAITDGAELAHFSEPAGFGGVGSNVVYFVANVTFSRAPANFMAADISVANGDAHPLTLR